MNIAILGGSFDPPHKGHAVIARRLLKSNYFDQIWFMPCYQHPFIKNPLSPDKRFEMTKFLENDNIKVSDFEIRKKTVSYSINTLGFLAKKYPKDKFCWIIGTDQIESLTKWKKWKEIINNFKLIIIPRSGFKKAEKELKNITEQVLSPKNIILIDRRKFPPVYVSSTLIRKKIKEKKSISNLVPKKIEQYIIQHKLYNE